MPVLNFGRTILGISFLVLASVLILWALISTPSFQKCEADGGANQASQEKKKTLEGVSLFSARVSIECAAKATDENSGFITALATAFLGYITYRLVVGGNDTTKKQLRAYVGILGGEIRLTANRSVDVQIMLFNTGRTPAHNVRGGIRVMPRLAGDERTGDRPAFRDESWVMTPQARWDLNFPMRYEIPIILPPGQTTPHIVIWGQIAYRDAFQSWWERDRVTTFAYRRGEPHRGAPPGTWWDPEPLPQGHSAT